MIFNLRNFAFSSILICQASLVFAVVKPKQFSSAQLKVQCLYPGDYRISSEQAASFLDEAATILGSAKKMQACMGNVSPNDSKAFQSKALDCTNKTKTSGAGTGVKFEKSGGAIVLARKTADEIKNIETEGTRYAKLLGQPKLFLTSARQIANREVKVLVWIMPQVYPVIAYAIASKDGFLLLDGRCAKDCSKSESNPENFKYADIEEMISSLKEI
jgi:hypothetical protein